MTVLVAVLGCISTITGIALIKYLKSDGALVAGIWTVFIGILLIGGSITADVQSPTTTRPPFL